MAVAVAVSSRLVFALMHDAGIYGLPGPARVKCLRGVATAGDLVSRKFHRVRPNELWVTDISGHPTREGKLYCCAVLDAFSRKFVGWSIYSTQDTRPVLNALNMAICNREPAPRRDRARRPRGSVHVVGMWRPHPQGWPHALVRIRRRRPGQRDDGFVLVLHADRAAQTGRAGGPESSSRTRSASTSRSSTTVDAGTRAWATPARSSSSHAPNRHPSRPTTTPTVVTRPWGRSECQPTLQQSRHPPARTRLADAGRRRPSRPADDSNGPYPLYGAGVPVASLKASPTHFPRRPSPRARWPEERIETSSSATVSETARPRQGACTAV